VLLAEHLRWTEIKGRKLTTEIPFSANLPSKTVAYVLLLKPGWF
jgi:hypothetical protein